MPGQAQQFIVTGRPQVSHNTRIDHALTALAGLALGDSFGQCFFESTAEQWLTNRKLPPEPWPYTDDTALTMSVVEVLSRHRGIDADDLAASFADRYRDDPRRAYGATAGRTLRHIGEGTPWPVAAQAAFDGMGSMGNGAAMRAAPIGAYFYDDHRAVAEHAARSAAPTHAHPDGQAGAIAVAIAASVQTRRRLDPAANESLLETVLRHTPEGETRSRLRRAVNIPADAHPDMIVSRLGNGRELCSFDTVPLSIWLVQHRPATYEDTLWNAVSMGGDRDTICAIVGGLTASTLGRDRLPEAWLRRAEEPLLTSASSTLDGLTGGR